MKGGTWIKIAPGVTWGVGLLYCPHKSKTRSTGALGEDRENAEDASLALMNLPTDLVVSGRMTSFILMERIIETRLTLLIGGCLLCLAGRAQTPRSRIASPLAGFVYTASSVIGSGRPRSRRAYGHKG